MLLSFEAFMLGPCSAVVFGETGDFGESGETGEFSPRTVLFLWVEATKLTF